QPARDQHATIGMRAARLESTARERFVAAVEIKSELALADEVEADARHDLELGTALRPIVRQRRPRERRDTLDPGEPAGRIEVQLAVVPRARHADAVEERGVHMEA